MDSSGYQTRYYPKEDNVGGTQGLNLIFLLLQYPFTLIPTVCVVPAVLVASAANLSVMQAIALALSLPVLAVSTFAIGLLVLSWLYSSKDLVDGAHWNKHIVIHDPAIASKYANQRIPMATFVQLYITEKADLLQEDFVKTLYEQRHKIFRFVFTLEHFTFFTVKFMGQIVLHSQSIDTAEIRDVYERGNDFYGWFLGERMIYTSAVFENENETLEQAQDRKLDVVCRKLHMSPGDRHLDIGCGWGTLICHSAKYYGATSLGVTLAKDQQVYLNEVNAPKYGVVGKARIDCMDYRDIAKGQKFDKITSLEMAEHVGIKNFQTHLLQVKDLLTDDGLFYMQIAGLRRPWQFEDLLWGVFMGTYIFPAADSSCPLAFVIEQAERAGFEIHSMENCGVHYSLTIHKWFQNWMSNKEAVVAKYGEWYFRLWVIFLGWSTVIASQGCSTVFLITMNKNRSAFDRKGMWVGEHPIAVQQ